MNIEADQHLQLRLAILHQRGSSGAISDRRRSKCIREGSY